MRKLLKYSMSFIFAVFFLYFMDILEVPTHIFARFMQVLLLFSGAFIILRLFERRKNGE
ncbi:hypothetical protein [Sporosarcina pasteurii]|uniref:hypothetical protein n=1 Tax=Sporosarcina pasteurii TaxID=1474 RepID=UPI001419D30B|nr:hypothetical protein [Sporosarcina pasteurii]MDS9472072.1 hypothetical protein [Sporosarcina pasteurii]